MLIEYYIYDFSGVKLFSKSFKTFQKAFDFCLNNEIRYLIADKLEIKNLSELKI